MNSTLVLSGNCTAKIVGHYTNTMIELVQYVLSSKFELLKDIRIIFTHQKVTSVKLKAVGNYMEIHSKVEVATDRPERDVLLTIAHELRHVYQDHYNTFPG